MQISEPAGCTSQKEKTVFSKNGFPVALVEGKAIHSLYNPVLEAQKFAFSLNLSEEIRYFILLECALGYIIPFLREAAPKAKIISLHVNNFYIVNRPLLFQPKEAALFSPDAEWPQNNVKIERFLENEIPDVEARYIKIIEWRPSLLSYGEDYARLAAAAASFIKKVDANKRTTLNFGKRWFFNVLKNIKYIKKTALPYGASSPCIVAGAGPGLDAELPYVKNAVCESAAKGEKITVIAAASAIGALDYFGVKPDVVVSSDGGNWALFHLYQYIRYINQKKNVKPPVLAFVLHAALPSQAEGLPLAPIAVSRLQELLLKKNNFDYAILPSQGSVIGSALDIALHITTGDIWVCGVDLKNYGVKTHTKSYYFTKLLHQKSSRFSPVYSLQFERAREIEQGGTFSIYRDWFNSYKTENKNRIFYFREKKTRLTGACFSDFNQKIKEAGAPPDYAEKNYKNRAENHLRYIVNSAKEDEKIRDELFQLFFSDDKDNKLEEIEKAAKKYG
ncbi:MAG: DUF115 domain-containing protein [Spirochaetaceae bacterium]|jgi:hypothetical protein|nr:DUF115 domain-containing protein [Spirochaetaceae bacterium]